MEFVFFLLVIVAATAIWAIKTYNKLQSAKQSIIEQASNINVSLKKRLDLASRIIDIAQGFGDHEKLTHMQVSANSSSENLLALSQSFPELKANETFIKSMSQLEELENNISTRRESYNKSVNAYNSYRSSFPTMLVANKLNFEVAPYYDSDNEQSLQQIATFSRDDSAAVQELISLSSEKLKNSASNLSNSTKKHLTDIKNSSTVQSALSKGEAVLSDAINESKKKIDELSAKKNSTSAQPESSSGEKVEAVLESEGKK